MQRTHSGEGRGHPSLTSLLLGNAGTLTSLPVLTSSFHPPLHSSPPPPPHPLTHTQIHHAPTDDETSRQSQKTQKTQSANSKTPRQSQKTQKTQSRERLFYDKPLPDCVFCDCRVVLHPPTHPTHTHTTKLANSRKKRKKRNLGGAYHKIVSL